MANWSGAGEGAAGGAMIGGALGGPFGAAAGGVLGGLGGLLGGDGGKGEQEKRLNDYYNSVNGRQSPQMGPAYQAQQSGYEGNRAALIAQLEALSRGQGPSLAQAQMREAMDRSTGAQASMAAGAAGRGMSAGAAYRNAANTTAGIQAQGARDMGQMRVQEQLGAMSQLGSVIGQGAQTQNQAYQFNASQQNAAAQANLEAQLRTMGYNDQAIQAILQQQGAMVGPSMGQQILGMGASFVGSGVGQQLLGKQLGLPPAGGAA